MKKVLIAAITLACLLVGTSSVMACEPEGTSPNSQDKAPYMTWIYGRGYIISGETADPSSNEKREIKAEEPVEEATGKAQPMEIELKPEMPEEQPEQPAQQPEPETASAPQDYVVFFTGLGKKLPLENFPANVFSGKSHSVKLSAADSVLNDGQYFDFFKYDTDLNPDKSYQFHFYDKPFQDFKPSFAPAVTSGLVLSDTQNTDIFKPKPGFGQYEFHFYNKPSTNFKPSFVSAVKNGLVLSGTQNTDIFNPKPGFGQYEFHFYNKPSADFKPSFVSAVTSGLTLNIRQLISYGGVQEIPVLNGRHKRQESTDSSTVNGQENLQSRVTAPGFLSFFVGAVSWCF